MSGHTTPFIPPLGTPSPDSAIHPPVIPGSITPSSHSSRSHSRPNSNSGTPAMPHGGWNPQYASSGGPPPLQMPFFGQGSAYAQTAFIPYSPYSNPAHSVGPGQFTPLPPTGPGGVSLDYRGYPEFLPPPTPLMATSVHHGAPPVNPPVIPAQGTPWHGGGGAVPLHHAPSNGPPPGTPWQNGGRAATYGGNWQQPAGYPPPPGAMWGLSTPDPLWGGVALSAPWGGGLQPAPAPPEQNRKYERETDDRMPQWTAGSHYGPVLTPLQLQVVKANLELNPLLTPVPESGPEAEKTCLRWNMLMESSLVHRSCDPLQVSWSVGRKEPATFPRLTTLKIVSEHYPWLIEVKARDPKCGVTCGEVIEAIASNMDKLTSQSDYEALSSNLKRTVLDAYRYNRSRNPDVPGGKMGEGLKRVDFIGQMTAFGGLEVDSSAVTRVCSVVVPGYVVLKCNKREYMTQEEVRAQHARGRAASQAVSVSRAASTRSSRNVPGSAAGSSIGGIGVDVESPSDSEDDDSE